MNRGDSGSPEGCPVPYSGLSYLVDYPGGSLDRDRPVRDTGLNVGSSCLEERVSPIKTGDTSTVGKTDLTGRGDRRTD